MKTTRSSLHVVRKTQTPRIIALLMLAVLALLALPGCNGDSRTNSDVDPTGVYKLVSVDGKAVPCEAMHEDTRMTIKSGVFTINADGTCSSLMKFAVGSHDAINREVKATYTRNDNELTMKWKGAGMTKGKVNGNTFDMTNEGMVLSYQK